MTTGSILKGTVRGRTIELDAECGLPDGQAVCVTLSPTLRAGEGMRRAFGAWAQDAADLDGFVEQARRDRAAKRPPAGA